MFRIASRLLLPVTLGAAVTAGCATPAAAGRSSASSRSELRATQALERHRARREAPGYADDFKGGPSLDAVTMTFVGACSYRFSDRLEVGLGVAVQNVFGEPLPMPVAATISSRLWLKSMSLNAELT